MSPMMFWRATSSVAEICRRSARPAVGANFQTSGMRAESESNMAVSSSVRRKSTGRGSFIANGTKQERGKHEEGAYEHCIGMCGTVCVGTSF